MIGDNTTSKKWTPSGSLQFVSVLQYYLFGVKEDIHSTPPPPNINVCASDIIHIMHMHKHAWKVTDKYPVAKHLSMKASCQASLECLYHIQEC